MQMVAVTGPIMYKKVNKKSTSRRPLVCTQHVPRLLLAVPRSCDVLVILPQLWLVVGTKAEYSILLQIYTLFELNIVSKIN